MNHDEIAVLVKESVQDLLRIDHHLLTKRVNERSISHRLAMYMTVRFSCEWQVDCEYNKSVDAKGVDAEKRLQITPSQVTRRKRIGPATLEAITVYPDIIVHKRGTNDENILVVEMKKSKLSACRDFEKLHGFVSQTLGYKHALFLRFQNGPVEPAYCWRCPDACGPVRCHDWPICHLLPVSAAHRQV